MSDTAHQSPLGVNVVGSLLQGIGLNINPIAESYMGVSKTLTDYTPGTLVKETVLRLLTYSINEAFKQRQIDNQTFNSLITIGNFSDPINVISITSTQTGFTVTFTTDKVTQFAVGTYIKLSGVTPTIYNGIWKITATNVGTFTVASTIDPGPATTPGTLYYQTLIPSLGNSSPFSFTWEGVPGWGGNLYKARNPATQWGFLRLIALQAWQDFDYNLGLSATGQYQDFLQSFQQAYSFIEYTNKFILSISNSRYFLQGTYSNMDDLTSADFTGVNLATLDFGKDLVTSGRAISLETIDTFGLPSNLLKNLNNNNGLTKSLTVALYGVGFTSNILSEILSNTLTPTKQQEAAMYTAYGLIFGPELKEILTALNCRTEGIETLQDLLNPKKLFPNSYASLTVPVYNPNPNLDPPQAPATITPVTVNTTFGNVPPVPENILSQFISVYQMLNGINPNPPSFTKGYDTLVNPETMSSASPTTYGYSLSFNSPPTVSLNWSVPSFRIYLPAGTTLWGVSGFLPQSAKYAIVAKMFSPPTKTSITDSEYETVRLNSLNPIEQMSKLLDGEEVISVHDGGGVISYAGTYNSSRGILKEGGWVYVRILLNYPYVANFGFSGEVDKNEYDAVYQSMVTSGAFDEYGDPKA